MSNPPERPKFAGSVTWIQKTLAGICGSSLLFALITLLPWTVTYLFNGDALFASELRKWLSVASFLCGSVVGIPQIKYLLGYIFDMAEFYQRFLEFKRNKDKE